jgi:glutaredoxin
MRYIVAAVLLTALFAANAQQIYRWTDEKGRVHLSDTPPPAGAKNIHKRGAGTGGDEAAADSAEPYALQLARKSFPVTLYSTPGCEACDDARKLLNARGIPFKEVSVADETTIEELKKVVGSTSVPALIVGSTVQKGFEEGTYQRVLDAAGYPKTGVLRVRNQAEPAPAAEPRVEVKPAAPAVEPVRGPYAPKPPDPEKK